MTNTLTQRQKSTQTQISLSSCYQSTSFLRVVAVGSGLTIKFLLLLQNSQRIFWMELSAITLETISHIYKSGANFLCKNPVGSEDANLCRMRGTASFIQYEILGILFPPTPQLHLLAAAHSASCNVKIKPTLLQFCTEKHLSTFVRGRALSINWEVQHH